LTELIWFCERIAGTLRLWDSTHAFDMDGDPAVEPQLDGFSRILPLPYRVALIIVLGTSAFIPFPCFPF
jgi:hypothetical protein